MKYDINYKISVMEAARAGKRIQFIGGLRKDWEDCVQDPEEIPWNWDTYNYRIKEETDEFNGQYVPYENAQEFLQDMKVHGPYLNTTTIEDPRLHFPYSVDNTGVIFERGIVLFSEMLSKKGLLHFIWQDGSPCGKLVKK